MKHKKLRTGLIGCGRFSVPGHAVYYKLNPLSEFAAVCDMREDYARKVAGRFGVRNVYTNYLEMMDKERLDAVSVCTPTFTHAELTHAAAERGINVLCEKPFATSPDEGRGMVDICREKGVVLHVGFNKRYDRGIGKARQLATGGEYGKCFHGEFKWHGLSTFGTVPLMNNIVRAISAFGYNMEDFSPDWRLSDPRIPGGVLEVFCHIVDLALWCFGMPDEICGDALKISPEAAKPDHVAALLKYRSGAAVYLTMSNKALALSESESGLFQCERGNINYATNSTAQTFFPAPVTVETGGGLAGRRRKLSPELVGNPLLNMPHYRKINNFLLDILGELPPEEAETVPRGESGVAVDKIIRKIMDD
jgi:predicted dehydrogenase